MLSPVDADILTAYTPALGQAEMEVMLVEVAAAAAGTSNRWTSAHPFFVRLSSLEPLPTPYH
jgi:hypothetical protein